MSRIFLPLIVHTAIGSRPLRYEGLLSVLFACCLMEREPKKVLHAGKRVTDGVAVLTMRDEE